jgi:glycosyltransferase involved in cell wall biosynthesis
MPQWPLVSVVIPAFNAERTIEETLKSVNSQTYQNSEIIVVDDGSSDRTPSIVSKFETHFPLTLITQNNEGVAAARNSGIHEAKGEFIAPVDADDLWHPTKIQKQVDMILRGGNMVGFVYCGRRKIGDNSKVKGAPPIISCRGRVLCQHLYSNFVGNGSALLLRRSAVLQVGGYSSKLREMDLEGSEDYLLQLEIARSWLVDVVPEYLVGYRKTAQQMSSDSKRMHRSRMAVYKIIRERCQYIPDFVMRWSKAKSHIWLANKLERRRRLWHFRAALLLDPMAVLRRFESVYLRRVKNGAQNDKVMKGMTEIFGSRHFMEFSPDEGLKSLLDAFEEKRLAQLSRYDEELPRVENAGWAPEVPQNQCSTETL